MIKVIYHLLETLEHLLLHCDMKEIKVEGHPDLFRDSSTKAIVNKNIDEYNTYISVSKKREIEKNKINNIESDLSSLKNEIDEIKNLLKTLISR